MFKLLTLSATLLLFSLSIRVSGELPKVRLTNVHHFQFSEMELVRTSAKVAKGTILLLPEGSYLNASVSVDEKSVLFLNNLDYNVLLLDFHIPPVPQIRDGALVDALQAIKFIKIKKDSLGLLGDRLGIMGIGAGGHLAARTVQKLDDLSQPDDLILINPSFMNETLVGTVYPAVMPPVHPKARLLAILSDLGNKDELKCKVEYAKTWKGYDGYVEYNILSDSILSKRVESVNLSDDPQLAGLLSKFLSKIPETLGAGPNPAAAAVEGGAKKRHADKLALVAKEKYDLIMIGNSITHNFEKPEYQPIWNQFFAPRKALNLGTSGYRTENLIWNIQNGELEGQSPKVVVVEIGTNNIDEKNYPTRHTAGQLAGGIETIVKLLREKLPETKIIVLRCFPGCYGGPNPTSHRAILERASEVVSRLADGKHIFYCDVNHVFLNMDGSINHEMMPDWLHPSVAGAKAWAQAMEPLLSELMGDQSLDTELPKNSAIVPVSKLESDSYDWWVRHADVLSIKDSINPEIVLIGNSITHFWGGEPRLKYADGRPRKPNGPKAWESVFAPYRVLNLGFGWDRTQNVLWRLDHGELDGLHPRKVIIDIGTNNTSETNHARMNTASEIVEGIRAACLRVRSKLPGSEIILMAIFPREQSPDHPRRKLINEINQQLEVFAKENNIDLVNIGPKMVAPDGTLPKEIANDFCHPTEKGYQIWADAIREIVAEP